MPMLKTRAVILAKIEDPYGVDAVPTAAANAILCEDPEIEPILKKLERNYVRSHYGASSPLVVGEGYKISFATELKGSGVAGTAPEIGVLLRACNFTETVNAGVDVDYEPNSLDSAGESVTLYFYRHNVLHKVTGCRGTFSLEAKVTEYGKLSWEFTGIYQGPTDAEIVTGTFNQTMPPVFRAAALTFHDYAAVIENLKIDAGNEITRRVDANAATGILEYFVGDRKVTGEIDPEVPALSDKNFWTLLTSGAKGLFTCTIGQSAGNRCVISGPKAQLDDLKYGEREKILTYAAPLVFVPDAGDDEITFKFN